MSFELSLYIVLVFFVPGVVVLGAVGLLNADTHAFLKSAMAQPSAGLGVLALALSMGCGALIDALRAVIIDGLIDRVIKASPPANYIALLDKERFPLFQYLHERTQEYYRFNANTTLALTFLIAAYLRVYAADRMALGLFILLLLLFRAAVNNRKATFWVLTQLTTRE
jgi:hypothetical protein